MRLAAMLVFAAWATALAPSAAAQQPPARWESAAPPAGEGEGVPSISMWRIELGYRGSFITDPGYNPFSTQEYLPQVSLAASRTLFAQGRLSFAPGIAWDYGSSNATARGDQTSLGMHRLTVPLEGRLHLGGWGYAFLRAAPGVALVNTEVDDGSAPAPLTKSRWLFATDVSAGYAWLAWPRPEAPSPSRGHLWLQGEAGYGWVVAERLNLAPDLPPGSPQTTSGVDLGSLAMSGAFFRIAAAASF
jgi:hypothetical protein